MRENRKRFGAGLGLLATIATLVVGLVLEATPADAGTTAGTRVTARWSGAIDTRSAAAVNAAYWSQYAPTQSIPTGWSGGSLSSCTPGSSSSTSNAATLRALNFVRSLAGLAPVQLSSTMNANAQRAALIMSANGALNHNPDPSWRCYTSAGATAASRSNLALAYPSIRSGQIVDLYMDEPGSNNKAVGHRRWLLNPFTTTVGTGSTSTANALMVIGPTSYPNTIEPNGRWSLSAGNRKIRFGKARVRVFRGTSRVYVHKYAVHNGYAQPTIVWQMPSGFAKTGTYRVVVSNIHKKGTTRRYKMSYLVRLFTPTP